MGTRQCGGHWHGENVVGREPLSVDPKLSTGPVIRPSSSITVPGITPSDTNLVRSAPSSAVITSSVDDSATSDTDPDWLATLLNDSK